MVLRSWLPARYPHQHSPRPSPVLGITAVVSGLPGGGRSGGLGRRWVLEVPCGSLWRLSPPPPASPPTVAAASAHALDRVHSGSARRKRRSIGGQSLEGTFDDGTCWRGAGALIVTDGIGLALIVGAVRAVRESRWE